MNMLLPSFDCVRCLHRWIPRKEAQPVRCPACKSPYWNRLRAAPTGSPAAETGQRAASAPQHVTPDAADSRTLTPFED